MWHYICKSILESCFRLLNLYITFLFFWFAACEQNCVPIYFLTSAATLLYVLTFSFSPLRQQRSIWFLINVSHYSSCLLTIQYLLNLQIGLWIYSLELISLNVFMRGVLSSLPVCKFQRYRVCYLYLYAASPMCTTTDLTALKPNCSQNHLVTASSVYLRSYHWKMRLFVQTMPTDCSTLLFLSLGEETLKLILLKCLNVVPPMFDHHLLTPYCSRLTGCLLEQIDWTWKDWGAQFDNWSYLYSDEVIKLYLPHNLLNA